MRTAILIAAALASAACANREPETARLDCVMDPDLRAPGQSDEESTITVERRDGDLVWTDSNGVDHRITAADSWQWRCRPHRAA